MVRTILDIIAVMVVYAGLGYYIIDPYIFGNRNRKNDNDS